MSDQAKAVHLTISGKTIQKIRAEVQALAPTKLRKPIAVLGDPARRVEVGAAQIIRKDLIDWD
jgi:hypothetical protein